MMVPRRDTALDDTALPLLNKIARFLVVAAGALVALEYLGIDVTPLLAGAGVAGLAVSLAGHLRPDRARVRPEPGRQVDLEGSSGSKEG